MRVMKKILSVLVLDSLRLFKRFDIYIKLFMCVKEVSENKFCLHLSYKNKNLISTIVNYCFIKIY